METELAVIGPGAIGTWLAWRLSAAAPVRLIGRSRSWLSAARKGVVVRGAAPSKRPRPGRIIPALSGSSRPAAVFVCVKSGDSASALRQARRLAGPDTPIVSLQNGLAHVPAALRAVGPRRAVFGACYMAVQREGAARVKHHAGETIRLGKTAENSAAASAARRWLLAAGLDAPAPQREDRVLWTKAVFNAATNPLGALTARTNGDLAKNPALWEILLHALREAAAVARAEGHPPLHSDMEDLVRKACLATPEQENSMLQDLRRGRRTEVEAILGPILEAARRRRLGAPVLDALRRFTLRLERELA